MLTCPMLSQICLTDLSFGRGQGSHLGPGSAAEKEGEFVILKKRERSLGVTPPDVPRLAPK